MGVLMMPVCEDCRYRKFDAGQREWFCSQGKKEYQECLRQHGSLYEPKGEVTGIMNAESLALDITDMIYKQGKAKILNVLESQIDNDQKLRACKRIVEDILTNLSRDVSDFLMAILGDWETEVTGGGELTPEEEAQARKEYEELKVLVRKK